MFEGLFFSCIEKPIVAVRRADFFKVQTTHDPGAC